MLSHKWTKKERDVAAGDVVLLAEAENDDPTYRVGIVDSVKPGEDGHVRTVSIRYTNPRKAPGERSPPKITTGLPMLTQAEASNSKETHPRDQTRPTRVPSNRSPARRPNKK